MKKPLVIYKASAGSGKTFTLATEYIKLLINNPQCYRNILAVTFTNKATEEMKTRILSQLYGISKMLPDSQPYMEKICDSTGLTPEHVSQRAEIALGNLLHNYNYFRVETIDSFFQSVMRNLARELELTANLRVDLNDAQVEEDAVDQLIEDLTSRDAIFLWLIDYITEHISDDKGWNVIGQIKAFGKTIFKDFYKENRERLNTRMNTPGFFKQYTAQLRKIREDAEEHMKMFAETFFGTLEEEGLSIDDLPYGKSGVAGFFIKLRNGIFDKSIISKRLLDCLENPAKWGKKSSPYYEKAIMLGNGILGDILRDAVHHLPKQWRDYQSAGLTLRHLNQLRLLNGIEQKVRQMNEEANRFLLSDTQQLLHSLISDSDSPFIFEKIGTHLEYVMIDEFQDTSTVQWENFKVLLRECMSHIGTENLIVGDVKQSIYRWRAGDWRLLNDIRNQFDNPDLLLDIKSLDTNYRSERNIVIFNNAFFRTAAETEYISQKELHEQAAEQLKSAYQDVEQIPKKQDSTGAVRIALLPSEDYQEKVLENIISIVEELSSKNIPIHKIAILVRTNAYIPVIAHYFQEKMPEIRIVSDEAFRLDASTAVTTIIHALHLLTHPDDELSKGTLVKVYQQVIARNSRYDSELLIRGMDRDTSLPEEYTQCQEELKRMPLYDLAERLYAIFQLQQLDDQSAYVCAFYDYLNEYISQGAADIDSFIKVWEETLCSKTIQSDEINGIRLISIHKSKGLEFDHVIIPFCDWQLEKPYGNILWCEPEEAPFNELPLAPIDYSQNGMMGTIYEKDYLEEHLQNTVDNLNLLYVAFTRPRKNLFVIGKRKAKNSRSQLIEACLPTIAEQLNGATLEGIENEDDRITFEYGELAIDGQEKTIVSPNVFLQPSVTQKIKIETFKSKVEFRQSNQSHDFIEAEDEEDAQRDHYIKMGSVLHQVFSTIRTTADIENALQQMQFEGILYDESLTAERIKKMLRERLENPKVADWFSGRWDLYNECAILSVNKEGKVQERRPDRVMTDGKQMIVVDFKFGSPKEEYHDQVREYMSLLSEMGYQHVYGYLWFVYSNKIIEIR